MPGKLTEQPVAGAGTEDDLYLVVQAVQSRKQTRAQLRTAILSAWQTFIRTFLASSTPANARTALGVAIGTDVQAYDADLTSLAGVGTAGLLARTGAGTAAARTLTGTANKVTVTNGDGVSGNPTLTLPDALTLVTPTVSGLLTLTGGQAAFPATQVPSADPNTLDDYEEGTWTMGITFSTPGDLNVVYSSQSGRYTKIGRAFLYEGTVTTTTFTYTTATGTLRVSGLPLAPAAGAPAVTLNRWTGVVSAVATPQIVGLVVSTNVQFEVMNVAAGTTATLTQANAASGTQKSIFLSGNFASA
jgi:hypothetical protein